MRIKCIPSSIVGEEEEEVISLDFLTSIESVDQWLWVDQSGKLKARRRWSKYWVNEQSKVHRLSSFNEIARRRIKDKRENSFLFFIQSFVVVSCLFLFVLYGSHDQLFHVEEIVSLSPSLSYFVGHFSSNTHTYIQHTYTLKEEEIRRRHLNWEKIKSYKVQYLIE